ncbi:hypothetical protein DM02DRAFT_311549 [Periconia macrospinosa]|uniref:Transposase Tc1-like domain-containing protein n=1 Tax=Periconia macrospinosa TaxID=97972 RepID=A0A2V1D304_9PLEO|nr:hypothetical protein DM02DRAFT_311549 [Periconia macrospinosa]
MKTPRRRLSRDERLQIHTLYYQAGWQCPDIARQLGVNIRTVERCVKGLVSPYRPRGRKGVIDTPTKARLIVHATANAEQRRKPWTQIAAELGVKADPRTIYKVFESERYYRRVATEKPFLTDVHKQNRLYWSDLAVTWPSFVWGRIIWSDEATFRLGHEKLYVTRKAEEKYLPDCCVPKFKDFVSLFGHTGQLVLSVVRLACLALY